MNRKAIPLKVQLAAALLQIVRADDRNPLIPYEHAKLMTADQIISLFQLDHYPIRHVDGGPDEPWNLVFRFIGEHREKTKRDVKEIAKGKRIRKKLTITAVSSGALKPDTTVYMTGIQTPDDERRRTWPKRKLRGRKWPKKERR